MAAATATTARTTSHDRRFPVMDDPDDDSVTIVADRNDRGERSSSSMGSPPAAKKPSKSTTRAETANSYDSLHDDDDDDESTVLVAATPVGTKSSSGGNRTGRRLLLSSLSPATQTLNVLSQDMDDLRYETTAAATTNNAAERPRASDASSSCPGTIQSLTRMAPPDPRNCLSMQEWKNDYRKSLEWIPISFDGNESTTHMGMVIQREQFFASPPHSGLHHCQILRVLPGELAEQSGVRVGDWVCRPMSMSSSMEGDDAPVLAQFYEVQEWMKTRRFRASVLRRRQPRPTASGSGGGPSCKKVPKDPSRKAAGQERTASPSEQDAATAMVAMCELSESRAPKHAAVAASSTTTTATTPRPDMGSLLEAIEHSERASVPLEQQQSATGKENHPLPHTSSMLNEPEPAPVPLEEEEEVMPFCKLCNHLKKHGTRRGHFGRKPRMHHAWCPQGNFFGNNGGKELLSRVQQGRTQLQCPACDKEYQTGKLEPVKSHSQLCLQNQKRLKKEQQEREEEEERKENAKRERRNPHKRRRRPLELTPSSEDEDEISTYRPRRKKQSTDPGPSFKASASAATTSKPSKPAATPSASTKSKGTTASKAATSEEVRRVTPPPADTTHKTSLRATSVVAADRSSDHNTNTSATSEPTTTTLKSQWESTAENPWGKHGHQHGDVLLYGPQSGLGHHETLLPSPRYILHPFAVGSNYRTTHCTPQEGYTVLCLCRDPSGSSPWGFGVTRDEFGHACLVESAQPMTAASGAKALGSEEIVGLKVHDMIVMINGHAVGGMTEVGLELELKTCGPRLTLVVSRYKHAEAAAQQRAAMERNMLRVMDRACRDERLLGWHEVGNAAVQAASSLQPAIEGNNVNTPASISPRSPEPRSQGDRMDDSSGEEERPDHAADDSSSLRSDLMQNCVLKRQVINEKKGGYSSGSGESAAENEAEDQEEWDDDPNAWNGCVCGEIHNRGTKLFWIQCEECDSWYDVSSKCVGFTEKQAEGIGRWTCWACGSDVEESSQASPAAIPSTCDGVAPDTVQNSNKKTVKDVTDSSSSHPLVPPPENSSSKSGKKTKKEGSATGSVSGESKASQTGSVGATKKAPSKKKKVKTYKDGRPSWKDRQLMKTEEGNLLSNSQPILLPDGTYRKPTGRVPKGFQWDKRRGIWAPKRKPPSPSKPSTPETIPEREKSQPKNVHTTAAKKKTAGSRSVKESASRNENSKKPSTSEEEISGKGDVHLTFGKGDLIFVEHHAWPGWNCEGGIGQVSKSYLDEEGDRVYDIKYVVGRSERGISAEFVYSYAFG